MEVIPMWHNMEPIWTELIAGILGAILGWFTKHYRDRGIS